MSKKSKVILKEEKFNEENGLTWKISHKGDTGVCLTMALGYVADLIVDNEISIKDSTQLLKDLVKDERDRRGEGTWL